VGAPTGPGIEWIHADIGDRQQMAGVLAQLREAGGVDLVVHLAAYYDFTGRNAPEYQHTNVEGMRNVLEISKALQPRSFIFASSAAACDFTPPGSFVTEDSSPDGKNPYSRSKRLGEELVREYSADLRACVVRFAAVYSDWCEYQPLDYFLTTWLSPGWRRRLLGGRGESAIPYMHIDDAVAFCTSLLDRHERFESGQVLLASGDGATSHYQLHAVATACQFGQRIRPVRFPRQACRMGIWMMDALGRLAGRRPFERPWMVSCIDRRLDIDASRTRAWLEWEPRERLDILRRIPFLIHNRKAHYDEWLRRNHLAARKTRGLASSKIHELLSIHQQEIGLAFSEYLLQPTQRQRLAAYLDAPREQLDERHRLLLEQLLCAVRTGDKAVFRNCCQHMAERWWVSGLPLEELWQALDELGRLCVTVLRKDPEAENLGQAIYDQITMTFRFAVDAVMEVQEHLGAHVDAPDPDRIPSL
jgi:nucleoside-diphosphate-sugar epimerase